MFQESVQFIDCLVICLIDGIQFFFTMFCTSTLSGNTPLLWTSLIDIIANTHQPWIVWGGFNRIQFNSDKLGGNYVPQWQLDLLIILYTLQSCWRSQLMKNFTWSNLLFDEFIVQKTRLGLCNDQWMLSTSHINCLLPGPSDHTPFFSRKNNQGLRGPRHFHFFTMWLSDESIKVVVHNAWSIRIEWNPQVSFEAWNLISFGKINNRLGNDQLSLHVAQFNLFVVHQI